MESGQFLGSRNPVFGWPKGAYFYFKKKSSGAGNHIRTFQKTIHFIRKLMSERMEQSIDTDQAAQKLDRVLPEMIEMAWAFIFWDISSTLNGACWRLFADQGADAKVRLRRAAALEIMGQEFSLRGKVKDVSTADGDNQVPERETIKDRIEIAFLMAQMKANGHDVSKMLQEKIRRSRARKKRAARA